MASFTEQNPSQLPASREAGAPALESHFLFDAEFGKLCEALLHEDIGNAQLSSLFRTFYRVRPFLPIFVRQILQRSRNKNVDIPQDWYLPKQFIAALEDIGHGPIWPDESTFAFVLTHDVETQRGMELMPALAELEEELGFRSAWNLVPYKYNIDRGLVRDLESRGFEFGIHGYNHDGKLFCSREIFEKRLVKINEAINDYGVVGFRTPMVHRNLHWMQGLDVDYDASTFDVDPFQAMPGGVGTQWPFLAGKFVELPYTLPQDHTLMISLGETTDRIWREKLQQIRSCHAMALMVTHPDYLDSPSRLKIYRDFLVHVKEEGGYWHALPRDVAKWTRETIRVSSSLS